MQQPEVNYQLDANNRFVVEGYNWARPFSNFFPGIAGLFGVPLWTYYVSKAQAVCSVGFRDKDGQILEFQSFNNACNLVATQGFRTFWRVGDALYEPFRRVRDPNVYQRLAVSAGELELLERNEALGLEMQVTYFGLANQSVGGLVREVRLRNLRKEARRLEWADGVGRLLPAGMTQQHVKHTPRHVEAMMGMALVDGYPLFRLKQSAADVERIEGVQGGNYYFSAHDGRLVAERVVRDPDLIFGEALERAYPWGLEATGSAETLTKRQMSDCKTPCAFTLLDQEIGPQGETTLVSLIGHVEEDADAKALLCAIGKPGFVEAARKEGRQVVAGIMDRSFTLSAEPAFDAYCGQNFLDNVMRGGMPLMLDTARGKSTFYVYSRQNGDLERDYHHFVVEPGYLSQGTGHYRSVLQNRRMDGWFWPEVGDANLHIFLDLMQLDGYNPLEVGRCTYRVVDARGFTLWLRDLVADASARARIEEMAGRGFTPGALLMAIERAAGQQPARRLRLVQEALQFCAQGELGGLHEGYWVDHWTYVLDLLDTYLAVWPEKLQELLIGKRNYRFFDNPDVVLPRREKTVKVGSEVRRYGAVVRDGSKEARIAARKEEPWSARMSQGEGEVYRTSLLVKLLVLLTNRAATLDPSGLGVDMEADKPGWNDSLNGLPALFGSALNESIELLRLARFLETSLGKPAFAGTKSIDVFAELATFISELDALLSWRLGEATANREQVALRYWHESNALKERYRRSTKHGIAGTERPLSLTTLAAFAGHVRHMLEDVFFGSGREATFGAGGVPHTYFVHRAVEWEECGEKSHQGYPLVQVTKLERRPVRRFLEGPVHWMKVCPEDARTVYDAVKASPLFDRKLGMYKSCEDMTGESAELGRAVGAYPRGWIENESVYLHMEYKYLLEILRSGLCDEFFSDMRAALVPFQPPERYGRSILEGASFIVSSAFDDAKHHGQAFQPRLSGITCEFINMWTHMVAGPAPFGVDERGELELRLAPRLPEWLFTREATERHTLAPDGSWQSVGVPANAFAYKLLGMSLVVYENPLRRPTWGAGGVSPVRYDVFYVDGSKHSVAAAALPALHAEAVRAGRVARMDVLLSASRR